MICPKCSQVIPWGKNFCVHCGTPVSTPPVYTASPVVVGLGNAKPATAAFEPAEYHLSRSAKVMSIVGIALSVPFSLVGFILCLFSLINTIDYVKKYPDRAYRISSTKVLAVIGMILSVVFAALQLYLCYKTGFRLSVF